MGRLVIRSAGPGPARGMLRSFVEVGRRLQVADPARIPASAATTAFRLGPEFPFHAYGEARFFVAERDGEPVARVGAMCNWHADDGAGGTFGYVGLYEAALDAADATGLLLEAAVAWLRDAPRRCRTVLGPIDFSTWYTYRFSVPTEQPVPTLWLEPRTGDHHLALWEAAGFRRCQEYVTTVSTDVALTGRRDAIDAARAQGFRLRPISLRRFEAELQRLYELSRRAFADAPLFTPIGWPEFWQLYGPVRRIIRPELVTIADGADGELAGFQFAFPNLAHAVRAMAGRSSPAATARYLAARRRADSVLLKTIAIDERWRGRGLGSAVSQSSYVAGHELGYDTFYEPLRRVGNDEVARLVARTRAEIVRRYVLLQLDPDREVATDSPHDR